MVRHVIEAPTYVHVGRPFPVMIPPDCGQGLQQLHLEAATASDR